MEKSDKNPLFVKFRSQTDRLAGAIDWIEAHTKKDPIQ